MRKLLTFVIALASIAFGACSPLHAQSSPLLGFPPGVFDNRAALDPPSGGGGLTVSLLVESTVVSGFSARTSFSNAIGITTTSGANSDLVCSFHFSGDPGAFSSVTYNGVAMTSAGAPIVNTQATAIFSLLNPGAGNLTLAATWTNSVIVSWACVEFGNVNASTPIANYTTNSGTSATQTVTVTAATGDAAYAAATIGPSNNASNTQVLVVNGQLTGGGQSLESSIPGSGTTYAPATGPTTAFSWTSFGSVTWAAAGVDVVHQ